MSPFDAGIGELAVSGDDQITSQLLRNIIDVVELEPGHVEAVHPGRWRRPGNADAH